MADRKDLSWRDVGGKCPQCDKETVRAKDDRSGDIVHYNCKTCNHSWTRTKEEVQQQGERKERIVDPTNGPGGFHDPETLDPSHT